MMSLRESQAAKYIAVGLVIGAVLGTAFLGNLFTFVTGEFNGVGPGFGQQLNMKVDTTTLVNTVDPGKFTGQVSPIASWLVQRFWQFTGRMWAESDGTWTIFWTHHAGTLTTDGKDFIEDQISDSPGTTPAAYISVSSSTHAPAAGDHKLWDEIDTGGGLDRVVGTYTSTGAGAWTVAKQFTADTGYTAVQCTGLCWSDTDSSNATTLCIDTFTPVTLATNDKITVTWSLSVS